MLKLVIFNILICFINCHLDSSQTVEHLLEFTKWKANNQKKYLSEEEANFRLQIFLKNLQTIKDHNQIQKNSYQIGINQFSDLTYEEFLSISLNQQLSTNKKRNLQYTENEQTQAEINQIIFNKYKNEAAELPLEFDWRKFRKISPVKNQGYCGSCWAFTTTSLFESVNLIRNNNLELYSEQELIDCSSNAIYLNQGCQGGWPHIAYQYALQNGISLSSQYSYQGIQRNCAVDHQTQKAFYPGKPIHVLFNQENNTTQFIKYLLNKSPLAVIVDASNWQNYKSGVFSNCTSSQNHVVLLVGYTQEGNWIAKNSWGSNWGEQGYITLSADQNCGLENNILGSII